MAYWRDGRPLIPDAGLQDPAGETSEDFFDYSKVVVRKPWGHEFLIFQHELVVVRILYLKHGAQTSMHCHPGKGRSLIVPDGLAVCSALEQGIKRSPTAAVILEKGVFHQTRAVRATGALVMEIETPPNRRDLVRLRDRYVRKAKGYETSEQYSTNARNSHQMSLDGEASDEGVE